MASVTQSISAEKAYHIGSVDELNCCVEECVRMNLVRMTKLECGTVGELKAYMSKLWVLNENTQQLAVRKIASVLASEKNKII